MRNLLLRVRLIWGVLTGRHALSTVSAGGLRISLLDLRPDGTVGRSDVRPVLEQALEHIGRAKGGFAELVGDHLRTVVAYHLPHDRVLHKERSYVCNFSGREAEDGLYLACLIIYAAVASRLARDQEGFRSEPDQGSIHAAAQAAQLRFLRVHPGWEDWARALNLPVDGAV